MSPAKATIPNSVRLCSVCQEPIPQKRLDAVPDTEHCIPCLEKEGDVPKVKRFDEFLPNGELVSTTFTENKAIERQMKRVNTVPPPDEAFDIALQDDSHLLRENSVPDNEHAYGMSEAFEPESDEFSLSVVKMCGTEVKAAHA